ncbi:MAG TPA: DUF4240 domain-containing protein [Drouetiella sp.]
MRRFEYTDEKSGKFWEIGLNDKSVTVKFGRTGTTGQLQTKSFSSHGEAQVHHDKLIAEKIRKGYVEAASTTANLSPAEIDESWFWKIISDSRRGTDGDIEAQLERIDTLLRKLSDAELGKFNDITSDLIARSERWDIWAAAYYDNDGCSDDGFMDWRAGLVLAGRKAYESVLSEPDSLAQFEVAFAESFPYLPTQIWEERHGKAEMPTIFSIADYPILGDDPFPEGDEVWFAKNLPRLRKKKRGNSPVEEHSENFTDTSTPTPKSTAIQILFLCDVGDSVLESYDAVSALRKALSSFFGNCERVGMSAAGVTLEVIVDNQEKAIQILPGLISKLSLDPGKLRITYQTNASRRMQTIVLPSNNT